MEKGTNTGPLSQIGIINQDTKKKPHNITIKNYNPNEPKVIPNMKYSDKQKYRRFKTKTEPKLHEKIMIDEDDDIVNTIKKAFGIEGKSKKNYSEVETSGAEYIKDPDPIEVNDEEDDGDDNNDDYNDDDYDEEGEEGEEEEGEGEQYYEEEEEEGEGEEDSRYFTADRLEDHPLYESFKTHTLRAAGPAPEPTATEITGAVATPAPITALERARILEAATEKQEKQFQAHLNKEFVELTEDDVKMLRGQYEVSGYLPNPNTYGRDAKERQEKQTQRLVEHMRNIVGKP